MISPVLKSIILYHILESIIMILEIQSLVYLCDACGLNNVFIEADEKEEVKKVEILQNINPL
jgi:hypothetical protein